jgi:hypothetical protein
MTPAGGSSDGLPGRAALNAPEPALYIEPVTCFFVREGAGADPELLKFDHDPRTDATAHAYIYLIHGGWVPDATGVLGEFVRRTGQYRQITEHEVINIKMRLAVNAAARSGRTS